MIVPCKYCEKEALGGIVYFAGYSCPTCNIYSVTIKKKLINKENIEEGFISEVESETLKSGNCFLVYNCAHKEAYIIEKTNGFRVMHQFSLNELTHELAVQWANKLKKYLIFQ
jgi:hypothetical protein